MANPINNPYVGPRTFKEDESDLFFGREREARDLLSLVMSERLVVFYAQSGAGKSSLINARLRPGLINEGFKVLPVGRVNGELLKGISEVDNIFVFNLILSLDQSQHEAADFIRTSLSNYLQQYHREATPQPGVEESARLLILDQFEEILNTNLQYWPQRQGFFEQLRQAMLDDPLLWVLFSMREDYVAALNPYAHLLPGKLRTRFHMRRLGHQAALEAIVRPAERGGRNFGPGVAQNLVDNLRLIHIHGQEETHLGEFVEPVQLQVVCYQLWENLKEQPPGEITDQDVRQLGDVDAALAQFYQQAIARVLAKHDNLSATYIRDWFEHRLMTEADTRGTVYRGAEKTAGLPTPAADMLVDQFLLRSETRAGGIWYELVHDRFVAPILKSNQAWRIEQGVIEQLDHIINIKLLQIEQTVEVFQTATYELVITNSGLIPAQFLVTVDGLDPNWVTISLPSVSLDEGEQAVIIIAVIPPRLPESRAGTHNFTMMVTSPEYANRHSEREATLHIKPYYEFMVESLSPQRQTLSWSKQYGEVILPLTNRGNHPARFRLEGVDEAQACRFEFDAPGEAIPLVSPAELRLHPGESVAVPIRITPRTRQLIGIRKRTYVYTVTTGLTETQQTSRTLLGQISYKPLVGAWVLLLISLLLLCCGSYITQPYLYNFMVSDGGMNAVITNETPVALRWSASYFTTDLIIEPPIAGLEQPLPRQGTVVAYPTGDTTYIFSGANMLSRFAPSIFTPPTRAVQIQVKARSPNVTFEAQPAQIVTGVDEEVVLSWLVENADNIKLFRRVGDNGPLEEIGDFSNQPIQSLRVTPDPNAGNTFYILLANNAYVPTPTSYPQRVSVLTPTPTRPPTPNIVLFSANPITIIEGEESTLSWSVNGVQEVGLQGIDGAFIFPPDYSVAVRPTGSIEYFLTIPGVPPRPVRVDVIQATPTPTSTPKPDLAIIKFFTITPNWVSNRGTTDVELAWSVEGNYTDIQLSSPHYNPISNLRSEGAMTLSVDQSTVFVLTVSNGETSTSTTASIKLGGSPPATATTFPTVAPAPIATATSTPTPGP